MAQERHSWRATRDFSSPKTAADWRRAKLDRSDPKIERMEVKAGEIVTPPCEAALRSWRENDCVEEVE